MRLLLAVLLALQVAAPKPVAFENIAAAAGVTFTHINGASADKYLVETMGSGALFFDYDNDGWIDLFLVDGGSIADNAVSSHARHRLFRNAGKGVFKDATESSGIRHQEYGMGACAGDVDNDGRIDLYITNYGPNVLYRNGGNGVFTDVTRAAGVGLAGWSTSCAFLDIDGDGDLDLFVTNYLDAPKTNNRFCGDPQRRIRVYCHPLVYPAVANVLYRNDGKGAFTDVSAETGLNKYLGNGLGVAVGDYDDDGKIDLVVTNLDLEMNSLYRGLGELVFTFTTPESGIGAATLPFVGFGAVFLDFDNDTRLDLAFANGHIMDNAPQFRAGATYAPFPELGKLTR